MPSLSNHQSGLSTKVLLVGDSGAGKTGALTSLVEAGYKLRILDFDNGLDSLRMQIEQRCPEKISNVDYFTLRDKYKSSPSGPILDGMPVAFTRAVNLLDKWKDGDVDLGRSSDWGEDVVVVLDSLTFLSESAFNWATAMNPSAKDRRQIYGAAQEAVENVISLMTSANMKPNVVVVAHIKYMERADGSQKGYPTSIGNALSPKIPAYFNSVVLCETQGFGQSQKRILRIQSTALVDTKSPASYKLPGTLPIENGLADFFRANRGGK